MSSIWLRRHGSSHSNEGGASADSWEIQLTPTGEVQAREAAHQWAQIIASKTFRLVTSPMLRARQTAEHVQALYPHIVLEVVDGLREFEPFDFSQRPAMQPAERKPLLLDYWAACDPERVGDGRRAESFARFRQRVEVALAGLQRDDVDTLAVCHGGVIKLADLLFDPGSKHLDERAFMQAWVDRATIHNCGLRRFGFQIDSASQGPGSSGPKEPGR